jgi:hypothetical protein
MGGTLLQRGRITAIPFALERFVIVMGKPPSYSLYVSHETSVHQSFTKAYAPLPAFIGFSASSGIAAAMLCVDYPANLKLQEGPRKVRI